MSGLYLSGPAEGVAGGDFLNCVMAIEWTGGPFELLSLARSCERRRGSPTRKNGGARALDVDLLFFDGESLETDELALPHPRMAGRRFVLEPLLDVLPAETVPSGMDRSLGELLRLCGDRAPIERVLDPAEGGPWP